MAGNRDNLLYLNSRKRDKNGKKTKEYIIPDNVIKKAFDMANNAYGKLLEQEPLLAKNDNNKFASTLLTYKMLEALRELQLSGEKSLIGYDIPRDYSPYFKDKESEGKLYDPTRPRHIFGLDERLYPMYMAELEAEERARTNDEKLVSQGRYIRDPETQKLYNVSDPRRPELDPSTHKEIVLSPDGKELWFVDPATGERLTDMSGTPYPLPDLYKVKTRYDNPGKGASRYLPWALDPPRKRESSAKEGGIAFPMGGGYYYKKGERGNEGGVFKVTRDKDNPGNYIIQKMVFIGDKKRHINDNPGVDKNMAKYNLEGVDYYNSIFTPASSMKPLSIPLNQFSQEDIRSSKALTRSKIANKELGRFGNSTYGPLTEEAMQDQEDKLGDVLEEAVGGGLGPVEPRYASELDKGKDSDESISLDSRIIDFLQGMTSMKGRHDTYVGSEGQLNKRMWGLIGSGEVSVKSAEEMARKMYGHNVDPYWVRNLVYNNGGAIARNDQSGELYVIKDRNRIPEGYTFENNGLDNDTYKAIRANNLEKAATKAESSLSKENMLDDESFYGPSIYSTTQHANTKDDSKHGERAATEDFNHGLGPTRREIFKNIGGNKVLFAESTLDGKGTKFTPLGNALTYAELKKRNRDKYTQTLDPEDVKEYKDALMASGLPEDIIESASGWLDVMQQDDATVQKNAEKKATRDAAENARSVKLIEAGNTDALNSRWLNEHVKSGDLGEGVTEMLQEEADRRKEQRRNDNDLNKLVRDANFVQQGKGAADASAIANWTRDINSQRKVDAAAKKVNDIIARADADLAVRQDKENGTPVNENVLKAFNDRFSGVKAAKGNLESQDF